MPEDETIYDDNNSGIIIQVDPLEPVRRSSIRTFSPTLPSRVVDNSFQENQQEVYILIVGMQFGIVF